ncbi:hypothetical protein D020_2914 [Vibrio parahaemolyticus SBR10290]|nr:hypothetical protein D052_3384 [Vibrio parahaemolyticus 10290]ESV68781.1 hypothetical protein D021_2070 [Vibrio parahaemolyticus 10296]ESW41716.1 hypothetical protein D022_4847 [Vibrio parahaemolyticus 12310]ETT15160.1 hypothetical protein D023_4774 [Vibrio parahaemolyticus 3256]ETX53540.1 hypothetical protein D020_2914 [Vibrio parahaemolyticus SBR10290]
MYDNQTTKIASKFRETVTSLTFTLIGTSTPKEKAKEKLGVSMPII